MKQTKSLLHFFIIAVIIILSNGCSESDSATNLIDDPLVGIWRLGHVTIISNDSVLTTTDLGFTQGMVIGGGGEFSMSMQSDYELISFAGTWTSTPTTLTINYTMGPEELVGRTISYPYQFTIDLDLDITSEIDYEGAVKPAIFNYYRP